MYQNMRFKTKQRRFSMIGDDKSALLMLDRELGTRIFPAGSSLDPSAYNK